MDLETIIPLVIVAVAYLFKAFEGARKKEKEKPRPLPKRPASQAKPVVSQRPGTPAVPVPGDRVPEGRWWEESDTVPEAEARSLGEELSGQENERRQESTWQEERSRNPENAWSRQRDSPLKQELSRAFIRATDTAAGAEVPAEVLRLREARRLAAPAEGARVALEPEESHEYAKFDLEDAVIKSVILERREF
ncbi:hypothetical protein EDD80_10321 [Anseongella ginsenosidimutans]|uniref:Uncharacterized protein n=1 Tax=Anseongella ginsenosidimutans TaxID=496056 RepID=A0A4R3KT98_9SPHI|nr:hypothetical protein [Anseongella ginsenosidimutans]QEC53289.1 hypothetical protein FRZ59_13700 [Anseongella ginsenosidimutans]TCS88160.1 hypothetical protein EDD80_10321 [Anseongella ginsenosidimutans]